METEMNEIEKEENQPRNELGEQSLPTRYYDGETGLDYTLVDGAYYLLDLLPEEEAYIPGVWARRYLQYLRKYRPSFHDSMRTRYMSLILSGIDRRAEELFEGLVNQMTDREGLTEELKLKDQMTWVGLANSIRNRAEEIVKAEVIYS